MWFMRTAAAVSLLASVPLAGAMLWRSSKLLGIDLFDVVGLLWMLVLTGTMWAIATTMWIFRSTEARARYRPEGVTLAAVGVMWIGAHVLMCAGVPGAIRWWIEEPDLARFSQAAIVSPNTPGPGLPIPRTVFGHECLDISVETYGVRYRIHGAFMVETWMVYAPNGPPQVPSHCTAEHYRGLWHVVYCRD